MLTEDEIRKMLQNPHTVDWSKLQPSDIGFSMGRALTEEEMHAHCLQNNIKPTILKKPSGGGTGSTTHTESTRQKAKKQLTLNESTKTELRRKLIPSSANTANASNASNASTPSANPPNASTTPRGLDQ